MIVTRTPFRLTLGGGGTDLPSFYRKHGGFILAMGLDKYMYVFLNRPIVEKRVILHYTKSEAVDHVKYLKHELAREALKLNKISDSIEISSLADIPASTGLGSSSSYLVGLLMAIHTHRKDYISLQKIAEEACRIEIEILKKGIGKQDQYMAAFGGMTVLEISKNGKVRVRQLRLRSLALEEMIANSPIYFLNKKRDAVEVLQDQDRAMKNSSPGSSQVEESLLQIKEIGLQILKAIEREDFDRYGELMDAHWRNKRKLSPKISYSEVDQLYEFVKQEYRVLGGKIIGAGGGGFLMLYCPDKQKELTQFMHGKGYSRLPYNITFEGTQVVTHVGHPNDLV
ncbi:MAG: galactokinase [Elusimicrobia bacterium]|nr:galactokinase [Elusimicrobiota bacterium]